MAKTKIHVGLEIGTSKTCMVVGEVKPDATVTIIGVGEVPSEGVVRGEIEDTSKVIQCIYDAWNMAQDHADVDIMTVYLSVTGAHIVGQNNRGTFRLPPDESIISQEHMDEVTEIARDVALGPEQFVLHRVPGLFSVDGQENLTNPAGLTGRTLDIDCHIIHGIKSRITNSFRCVREVPLDIADVVLPPLPRPSLCSTGRSSRRALCLLTWERARRTMCFTWTASLWPPDACRWAVTTFPMTSR